MTSGRRAALLRAATLALLTGCALAHSDTALPETGVPELPREPAEDATDGSVSNFFSAAAAEAAMASTTSADSSPPKGWPECSDLCEMEGSHLACAEQVAKTAALSFGGGPGSCEDAYGVVRQKCPVCSGCSVEESGCELALATLTTTTTTLPTWDCTAQEDCLRWSAEQEYWCYWHRGGVLCRSSTTAPQTTVSEDPVDCQELLERWVQDDSQLDWCCRVEGLGCVTDLAGEGVRPGEATQFRRKYDESGPAPAAPPVLPGDVSQHWVATVVMFGGCAALCTLLVAGRLRRGDDIASLRSYEDVEPGTGPILDLADDADEPTDDARE